MEAGVVSEERWCIRCGYALRGLEVDGQCPECAESIAKSLRGEFLKYRDDGYLRRLQNGGRVLLLSFGLAVCAFAGLIVVASMRGTGVGRAIDWLVWGVGGLLVLHSLGWWLFTSADPGGQGQREERWRVAVRIGLVCGLVMFVMRLWVDWLGAAWQIDAMVMNVLRWVTWAWWGFVQFAGAQYISGLAARVPEVKLVDKASTYGRVVLFLVLGGLLVGVVERLGLVPLMGGMVLKGWKVLSWLVNMSWLVCFWGAVELVLRTLGAITRAREGR